jgi:SAM-dependent methyltransferase
MSPVHDPIESYVLGNTVQEQDRLKLQGRFLEKWTEQFLLSAGVERGMNVLDVGCGMGDVSLLAARLVGATGRATGIIGTWLSLSRPTAHYGRILHSSKRWRQIPALVRELSAAREG